jgi:hypothetical protein
VTYIRLEQQHTNGAHKNNNDNNTTPIFIGLNKTTQKTRTPQEEGMQIKIRSDVLKHMYFNVKEGNVVALEYFNLRANAV